MDPAFSRSGEPATAFERELLTRVDLRSPRDNQQQWLALARRIGLDALFAVFDEFGDDAVWIPTRSSLIQPLWSDLRAREAVRLSVQEGLSARQIAHRLNIGLATVQRAIRGPHGRGTRCGEKQAK